MQVVQELYEEVGNFVLYVIPSTGIMPTMNWHITVRTRTAKHIQLPPRPRAAEPGPLAGRLGDAGAGARQLAQL